MNVCTIFSGATISRYSPLKGCSSPSAPRSTKCQPPPTRKSTSHTGSEEPRLPHHCFRSSGVVTAFHTRSRGALNSRVSRISVSDGVVTFRAFVLAAIVLPLLLFEPLEELVEPLVAFVPRTAE